MSKTPRGLPLTSSRVERIFPKLTPAQTGPDLTPENLSAAPWNRARPPYLLETSLPEVFAVGDVRGGIIKRVASAVGEGSIAISFVHQVLQE